MRLRELSNRLKLQFAIGGGIVLVCFVYFVLLVFDFIHTVGEIAAKSNAAPSIVAHAVGLPIEILFLLFLSGFVLLAVTIVQIIRERRKMR